MKPIFLHDGTKQIRVDVKTKEGWKFRVNVPGIAAVPFKTFGEALTYWLNVHIDHGGAELQRVNTYEVEVSDA